MLHETLWRENERLARACLAHPFVQGLRSGALPADAFARYVAQDAFFLRAFARAYALALARCPDVEGMRRLHALLGGGLDELRLHARYAERLGIELARVAPYPATSAYTDFLVRTAALAPLGSTLAAMTPCMRLYAFLGQTLAGAAEAENPYRDWITTYASAEFEQLAHTLETLLDAYAEDAPAVGDAYRYALECELAFFAAPREPQA